VKKGSRRAHKNKDSGYVFHSMNAKTVAPLLGWQEADPRVEMRVPSAVSVVWLQAHHTACEEQHTMSGMASWGKGGIGNENRCTRPSTVPPCTRAYLTLGPAFWLSFARKLCKTHTLAHLPPFLLHFARANSTTLVQKTPPQVQMTSWFCVQPKLRAGTEVEDKWQTSENPASNASTQW
jgi:hypothetical protein